MVLGLLPSSHQTVSSYTALDIHSSYCRVVLDSNDDDNDNDDDDDDDTSVLSYQQHSQAVDQSSPR